uniref:Tc1-like transposase DDE domain-containing protein n=1 Tax=Cacopsylla melanoneura TaxID=428564 RepID=A0A8D8Y8V6_9HEMI
MERHDIVKWRWRFLSAILQRDVNFKEVVWLDETWVNAGHSVSKTWTDDSVQGSMKGPTGKGGRLIILYAGSSEGFIPGVADIFRSKKTGDYHEEMNSDHFKEWFEFKLLQNLKKPTVIVMDNGSYHSKILDRAPTANSKKAEIISWLVNHGVPSANDTMRKVELMELVKLKKPSCTRYEIDTIAEHHGHRVIRLPPYHCHFNPIELIWANVKGQVRRQNTSFTLGEVERLTHKAIHNVSAAEWDKVVEHTKKVIQEAWKIDGLVETALDEIVISTENSDSSSEESSSSENEDGW